VNARLLIDDNALHNLNQQMSKDDDQQNKSLFSEDQRNVKSKELRMI